MLALNLFELVGLGEHVQTWHDNCFLFNLNVANNINLKSNKRYFYVK